jgi:hypothetical protein
LWSYRSLRVAMTGSSSRARVSLGEVAGDRGGEAACFLRGDSTRNRFDSPMTVSGASAGALSGLIVGAWGYPMLALVSALAATPFVLLMAGRASARGTQSG